MLPSRTGLLGGGRTVVISANQTNYNLHTALNNPGSPVNVVVVINAGVVVSSNSTATPAFDEGSLPSGSRVYLINNGSIRGMGGAGGKGYGVTDTSPTFFCPEVISTGINGSAGGPALKLSAPTTIVNASGEIFGGGGGGGGGEATWYGAYCNEIPECAVSGNGGGGGQGGSTSNGGAAGDFSVAVGDPNPGFGGFGGNPGTSGNSSSAGNGGSARTTPVDAAANNYRLISGIGGSGGAWGTAGSAGNTSSYIDGGLGPVVPPRLVTGVGAGGAAGKAIDLNGFAVTWVSGNDSTHVKGAVS